MRRVWISGVLVETVKGDIAEVEADAIVNAANSELWMGSGVAGAIKRKGGAQIESEAVSKGPARIGEAVATSAGLLKAKWVIHAAVMGPDLITDGVKIQQATKNALKLAEELEADSVAMPSLGTGVGGFPMQEAADIMTKAVLEHASMAAKPKRIIFVLFSDDARRIFDRALERSGGAAEVDM